MKIYIGYAPYFSSIDPKPKRILQVYVTLDGYKNCCQEEGEPDLISETKMFDYHAEKVQWHIENPALIEIAQEINEYIMSESQSGKTTDHGSVTVLDLILANKEYYWRNEKVEEYFSQKDGVNKLNEEYACGLCCHCEQCIDLIQECKKGIEATNRLLSSHIIVTQLLGDDKADFTRDIQNEIFDVRLTLHILKGYFEHKANMPKVQE